MRKRVNNSYKEPILHTLIISDIRGAWEKMYWEVDVFGDIQRSYPEEHEPLAYAALNTCISASSLENWSLSAWRTKFAKKDRRTKDIEFRELLEAIVPNQGLCVDVANTTKHGHHREDRWRGGELNLRYDEADEDSPSGFTVLKSHVSGKGYLYNDLHDLPRRWWMFLQKVDLVTGEQPTPDWWQRKMSRMFGQT